MDILLVDNFDSFTHNLYQLLMVEGEALGLDVEVVRNNTKTLASDLANPAWSGIVISPGPGGPAESGLSKDMVRDLAGYLPILGVCLGHQVIAATFGAKVIEAERAMHGKTSVIHHNGQGLFQSLPTPLVAARYHSLIVERETLSSELIVDAWTDSGEIMALRHRSFPLFGIQFHPESFMTPTGSQFIKNFLYCVQHHDFTRRQSSAPAYR